MVKKCRFTSRDFQKLYINPSGILTFIKVFFLQNIIKPLQCVLYTHNPMGNIGEDYPHLITDGAMVDQVQHLLS